MYLRYKSKQDLARRMNQAERQFHTRMRDLYAKRNDPDVKPHYHTLQAELESEYHFYRKHLNREYQLRHRLGFFNEPEAKFVTPEERMREVYEKRRQRELEEHAQKQQLEKKSSADAKPLTVSDGFAVH